MVHSNQAIVYSIAFLRKTVQCIDTVNSITMECFNTPNAVASGQVGPARASVSLMSPEGDSQPEIGITRKALQE